MNQVIVTFIFFVGISLLLLITEMIYRKIGLKGELTRKFAHSIATLSTLTFPYFFGSHWYVLILVVLFFIILFISKKGTHLKSIHGIPRSSAGSYLLPVGIYIPYLISGEIGNDFLFYLPILILAISDTVAGLLGMYSGKNNYKITIFGITLDKTRNGTLGFLISCFIISFVALYFYQPTLDAKVFGLAAAIAIVSSFVELLSGKGTDNLSVPVSVLVMLILFL